MGGGEWEGDVSFFSIIIENYWKVYILSNMARPPMTNEAGKQILERIRKIMGVEAGTIYLKEKDHLRIAAAFNTKIDTLKKYRLKIGQGVAGYVAAKGKTMVENDTRKSSQYFQEIDKLTGFTTHSVLCVPIISGENILGAIYIDSVDSYGFREEDQLLLDSLAGPMAVTIEKDWLISDNESD